MSRQDIRKKLVALFGKEDVDLSFDKSLSSEMQSSFLEYAMSVIKSRALPDYRDGLKPVHRRIIYAAAKEGLTHDKKYKKSAAIVGSVMGSYHPHGDMAIYDALVRMAQDFSLRYPLIQGQGNFGSIDGDSPAAMRYTEARLSELCSRFTDGLGEDWVEMVDNYDQSKKEPVVLPTLIPNLLVNGSEGIAVGLATKIPPHNLAEVIDASIALIENPNLGASHLTNYIKGPDFPTGGEILNYKGVLDYFGVEPDRKKIRSFKVRGKVIVEEEEGRRSKIVITEIPYGVKKASIVKQIAEAMVKNKDSGLYVFEFDSYIRDIRDESSREGIRIVIEYEGCSSQVIINNLYKYTRLQVSYCTGLVVLVGNEPKKLNLLEAIKLYVDHQFDMMRRRSVSRIGVLEKRIHILEGRLRIIDDVLNAVKLITDSDSPERDLKDKYSLSDEQVKDIMDLRVRRLKKLSVEDMKGEMSKKIDEKIWNEDLLASEDKQKVELIRRLSEIRDKYGDARRTVINELDDGYISKEETKHYEDAVFILSKKSYLSQVPFKSFRESKGLRTQTRTDVKMIRGDVPAFMVVCNGRDDLLFFTDKGRVYRKKVYEFELKSGLSWEGRKVSNLMPYIPKDETIVHMMCMKNQEYFQQDLYLIFVTKCGYVKKTHVSQFKTVMANGKKAMRLFDYQGIEDKLSFVLKATDKNELCLVSSEIREETKEFICSKNRLVRCSISQFQRRSRISGGVRGIRLNLKDGQYVLCASTTYTGDLLVSISDHGEGKFTHVGQYRLSKKGAKGILAFKHVESKTQKDSRKLRKCASCVLASSEDVVLIAIDRDREDSVIKLKVQKMERKGGNKDGTSGRIALGKSLLNREWVSSGMKVAYCTIVDKYLDIDETEDISKEEEDN